MIELRRPHWILALTLAVMVHLAAYILTYSLPGVPQTFRGGGLYDRGDDFPDAGNGVLVALGGASESAGEELVEAEAEIDGPPLEPNQALAEGFVEADGDLGSDAKPAEPVEAPKPTAEALAEETVDLQSEEAGTAEVIGADPRETELAAKAPPIPERKPEPPVIQPELEAFAQRFSVQGPTAPTQAPVQRDAPAEIASAPPLQAPVQRDAPAEIASAAPLEAPVQSDAPAETASAAPLQAPVQSDAPAKTASAAPTQASKQNDAPAQTASAAAVQGNAKAAAQPSARVMSFASQASGMGNASGNELGAVSRLNYEDRVLLWLKRHGTYPREGLRFKMEGIVLLRFAIRRDGTILYYDLIKESSWDTLNGAVRRMMDRSSPVPRIPRDIAKDEIVFTIPVRFTVHEGAALKRPRAERRSTSRRVWSR